MGDWAITYKWIESKNRYSVINQMKKGWGKIDEKWAVRINTVGKKLILVESLLKYGYYMPSIENAEYELAHEFAYLYLVEKGKSDYFGAKWNFIICPGNITGYLKELEQLIDVKLQLFHFEDIPKQDGEKKGQTIICLKDPVPYPKNAWGEFYFDENTNQEDAWTDIIQALALMQPNNFDLWKRPLILGLYTFNEWIPNGKLRLYFHPKTWHRDGEAIINMTGEYTPRTPVFIDGPYSHSIYFDTIEECEIYDISNLKWPWG
ncbi:MAG: hypothetical protein K8R54_19550 [Bacteroidales bacterium]|nr:hypothetical protein [Bacteroidales bacterium]